jgi:hypothetical protein
MAIAQAKANAEAKVAAEAAEQAAQQQEIARLLAEAREAAASAAAHEAEMAAKAASLEKDLAAKQLADDRSRKLAAVAELARSESFAAKKAEAEAAVKAVEATQSFKAKRADVEAVELQAMEEQALRITRTEVVGFWSKLIGDGEASDKDEEKRLRQIFDDIDLDGGGTLDREELKEGLMLVGMPDITDAQIGAMMKLDGSLKADGAHAMPMGPTPAPMLRVSADHLSRTLYSCAAQVTRASPLKPSSRLWRRPARRPGSNCPSRSTRLTFGGGQPQPQSEQEQARYCPPPAVFSRWQASARKTSRSIGEARGCERGRRITTRQPKGQSCQTASSLMLLRAGQRRRSCSCRVRSWRRRRRRRRRWSGWEWPNGPNG